MRPPQTIELTEYRPRLLPRPDLPGPVGELLWRTYGRQVEVEFPNPKTGQQWRLTAQGWVGHIPLTPEFHLALQPKVKLANLFRMLDYAYQLKSFRFLAGLVGCQTLAEFYEELASILAKRVLDRGRKGFYRAYLPRTERLPYLRGRLEMEAAHVAPGRVGLPCHYQEHTADIADNQILAWTLFCIARSGLGSERVLPLVRRAYRALQGLVTPVPHPPADCVDRLYHRLNEDYRPLHALCRFFLEQSGPGHQVGERTMLPFLVDMARLYERFVAEWLKHHLPPPWKLAVQERVEVGRATPFHFEIDLVLYDAGRDAARCVLDTKYKTGAGPAPADIHQMISYAHTKGCSEAVLVYPARPAQPFDEVIRGIRVRSLTFALDGDLEQAGQDFLRELGIGKDS